MFFNSKCICIYRIVVLGVRPRREVVKEYPRFNVPYVCIHTVQTFASNCLAFSSKFLASFLACSNKTCARF